MNRIVVVGAGISGLSTGFYIDHYLREDGQDFELRILESDDRVGGKIRSHRHDGFLLESGPNGFLDSKPSTLELCDLLGIGDRVLRSNDAARKRFIYANDFLHPLPESAPAFLKSELMSTRGKLRLLGEPFARKRPVDCDETVADFVRRRIGAEALDKLIGPMVSGVYAGNPETMSLRSSFSVMAQLEEEHGGLFIAMVKTMIQRIKERRADKDAPPKAKSGPAGPGGILMSFDQGLEVLVTSLQEALQPTIQTGARVVLLDETHGDDAKTRGKYRLLRSDGEEIFADCVVFAVPSYATAEIFSGFDSEIAKAADEIPYSPVSIVGLGYEKATLGTTLNGFGFLIPFTEQRKILGNLWDSCIFENRAPESSVLLRAMTGGARTPEHALCDDTEMLSNVQGDLQDIMDLRCAPHFTQIYRHERAIPQYVEGHEERLETIESRLRRHAGLFVTGNAYRGVGINDCTLNGRLVAESVREFCR